MTAPQPSDALLATIQERIGAATLDLVTVLAAVRKRLTQLAADPTKLQGPALNAIVDEVITAMTRAARRAGSGLDGDERDATKDLLDEKRTRLATLAGVLRGTSRPSLAKAFTVITAADALVVGLAGVISDHHVREQTDTMRRKLRFRDAVAMWVPERDACARCLRYAGLRSLRPTDQFPAGLSYDPAQESTDAGHIAGPPLHPHCRCELQLVAKGDSQDASDALVREAERSIMKGWALESEGNASRERAAKALLERGKTVVPVSVRREAAKRLGEGERFTRRVPSGHETPAEKAFLRSYSGVYR